MEGFAIVVNKENAGQALAENALSAQSPIAGKKELVGTPTRGLDSKKRPALNPIENSPGLRSSTPSRKRNRRRASSLSKRVSFGGEHIKVYNQVDEEWKTPSKQASPKELKEKEKKIDEKEPQSTNEKAAALIPDSSEEQNSDPKAFDDLADDTLTMPDLQNLIREDEASKNETVREENKSVSTAPSKTEGKGTNKLQVFMDDDITHGVARSRLSELFEPEDTETVVLGGLSRQNSDLSEGDITKNIPSLADLVAGEQEQEQMGKKRSSEVSDESDSFDRMYGKVFGDDATEDDLTNYTSATNVTMTHNITANVPSLTELLEKEDRGSTPATTAAMQDDDENVTREIPTFSALLMADTASVPEEKAQGKSSKSQEKLSVADGTNDETETPPLENSLPESTKDKVEEKVKRLSEPIKLGTWSANLIANMHENEANKDPTVEENETHEITAELADNIFGVEKGKNGRRATVASIAPPNEDEVSPEAPEQENVGGSSYTVEDFLHNANLRFLDDMSNRQQRETSFGERSENSSPSNTNSAEDRLINVCSTRILLQEVEKGCEGLEKATISTQEKTKQLGRSIQSDRPFIFMRIEDSTKISKEDLIDNQMALKRLKNFCRLLAKRHWYEWRAGFESSIAQKLVGQNKVLSSDLSLLEKTSEALARTSDAADADARLWSLKALPSSMQTLCPAELVEEAKQRNTERKSLQEKLVELKAQKEAMKRREVEAQQRIASLQDMRDTLVHFSSSIEESHRALQQASHRNSLLSDLTGISAPKIGGNELSLVFSSVLKAEFEMKDKTLCPASVVKAGELDDATSVLGEVATSILMDAPPNECMSSIRKAARFLSWAKFQLAETRKVGKLVDIQRSGSGLAITSLHTFSRLASRRKFSVKVRHTLSPERDSIDVLEAQQIIGNAPTTKDIQAMMPSELSSGIRAVFEAVFQTFL